MRFLCEFSDLFLNLTLNTHPDLIPAERERLCRLLFGIEIGYELLLKTCSQKHLLRAHFSCLYESLNGIGRNVLRLSVV